MKFNGQAKCASQYAGLAAAIAFSVLFSGCQVYSTAAKMGLKVVGQAVNDDQVATYGKQLIGQPVSAADTAFGSRLRTLEEIKTGRQMFTYPVKDDLLNSYRWAVEAEKGQIVALSKLQQDPGGGQDIAKKLMLEALVIGKPQAQVETNQWFQKPVLVLRDAASGNLLRVYDISTFRDFMGATYCVLEYDHSDICRTLWIVGVPATTAGSSVGK